ncbi:hypothetical protein KY284_013762 [Solanum tuberosum]|nr:hypothetical protein KY284_013762 [Solanum tuberosum]
MCASRWGRRASRHGTCLGVGVLRHNAGVGGTVLQGEAGPRGTHRASGQDEGPRGTVRACLGARRRGTSRRGSGLGTWAWGLEA